MCVPVQRGAGGKMPRRDLFTDRPYDPPEREPQRVADDEPFVISFGTPILFADPRATAAVRGMLPTGLLLRVESRRSRRAGVL